MVSPTLVKHSKTIDLFILDYTIEWDRALILKWRPLAFDEMYDFNHIKIILKNKKGFQVLCHKVGLVANDRKRSDPSDRILALINKGFSK